MAEKTVPKQRGRGRPFPKGVSGNPEGRPQGSRNRATILAEELLDNEAERLVGKAVEMALAGDVTALRLCLERLIPPKRERPAASELPPGERITITYDAIQQIQQNEPERWREIQQLAESIKMVETERRTKQLAAGASV